MLLGDPALVFFAEIRITSLDRRARRAVPLALDAKVMLDLPFALVAVLKQKAARLRSLQWRCGRC